jgi:hypothetical protein
MESPKPGFAFSLLAVCGILTTSFSLTYGRWSASRPISHYINLHAIYISATGLGLLCSLGINVSFKKRIEALESALNQRNGENRLPGWSACACAMVSAVVPIRMRKMFAEVWRSSTLHSQVASEAGQ